MARWWATGASVRGASHLRSGQANQDALRWRVHSQGDRDGHSGWAAMAVADGHGSEKYFRSEKGADLAVKAALEIAVEMVTLFPRMRDIEGGLQDAKNWFQLIGPQLLVRRWIDFVLEDLDAHPYSYEERSLLDSPMRSIEPSRMKRPATQTLSAQLEQVRPYGAAVAFVLATDGHIAYASIGDVDLVAITGNGTPVRALSMSEEVGEATFSLCMPNAASYFQTEFHTLTEEGAPSLVFVSSDGFSKSFATEREFLDTCRAYSDALRPMSIVSLSSDLIKWLEETTNQGSGDDITVGLLFNTDHVSTESPRPHAEEASGEIHVVQSELDEPAKEMDLSEKQAPEQLELATSHDTAASLLIIGDAETFKEPRD